MSPFVQVEFMKLKFSQIDIQLTRNLKYIKSFISLSFQLIILQKPNYSKNKLLCG